MVRASTGNRRADILDAAIDLVAGAGLRGLTHRAVDAAVGLSEGSTSAYFRTRAALLNAVVARLDERIGADVDELAAETAQHPGDPVHAVAHTMKLLDRWLSDPAPLAARLELSLESSRRPELGEAMTAWRTAFDALVARIISDVGLARAGERASLVTACLDGLLFRALTGASVDEDGGVPMLDPDTRADVVEQARFLLTSLLVSAHLLDTTEGPLPGNLPRPGGVC
ncbi:TetR/AcrR family transcriptional regulator [Cryptosporangium aurantiacum]|uniref:Transcriptional regulator, TetR family n=1 Tax=Cryptosporangium aurantiacum TaxID=134849 RepID=A0A1M7MQL7_9ACTN|nr:TetR/AcrR family transcriptional regulator [Cryptosporangium aurantiacum]SHM93232.1 transcriptional regulator, TetR family [Cryptosporangium aurantiacum]